MDSIYYGEGIKADSLIPPNVDYYARLDQALVKYPFNERRVQQLMEEAGYPKGPDGIFTSPSAGRFSVEVVAIQNPQNEGERAIMASTWRSAGFDVTESTMPVAQSQDGEARAKFSGLFTTGLPSGEDTYATLAVTPGPQNRWNGFNRGSWSNPEFERLAGVYQTTLEREEQLGQILTLAQIFSDELPSISVDFSPRVTAFVSALQGPQPQQGGNNLWRVQDWELM